MYHPTEKQQVEITCEQCGSPVPIVKGAVGTARRRFCGPACRQRAYRQRKTDAGDLPTETTPAPVEEKVGTP